MKGRWLRRCARLLPVALALLGGAGCDQDEPPAPGPPPAVAADSPAVAADPVALPLQAARKAMLSVYFHARFEDSEWMPEAHRPLPLEEAVSIVRGDTARFAESRRRRAIAKLYSAPRTDRRRNALVSLQAPLAALDGRVSALEDEDQELEPGSFEFLDWTIGALEELLGSSIPDCERTFPKTDSDLDWTSSTTTATGWLAVGKEVDALSEVLDPQNWDVCASENFEDTRVARKVANDYPVDGNFDAERAPPPPEPGPGSAWSGVLFEHFVVDLGQTQVASFRVLLDISSTPVASAQQSYEVGYRLRESIYSTMGLFQQQGGIAVDEGCARATKGVVPLGTGRCVPDTDCKDPGRTCVEAKKVFRLAGWGGSSLDFWANFWTSIAFQVLADEAYEMVCCEPTG